MANEPLNEVLYNAAQKTITRTPALGQAVSASSVPVVIASDQSVVAVNQSGVTATGTITALNASPTLGAGTAGSAVSLALNGATGWTCDVRGTFVATLTMQGTIDGTNWFTITGVAAGGGANSAGVSTATAPGAFASVANGMHSVRVTATAFTSGTATIVLRAMQAAGLVQTFPVGQTTQAVSGTLTGVTTVTTVSTVTNSGTPAAPATPLIINSAATTNGQLVLTGTSGLQAFYATNIGATVAFVKLYNKATAPTVGTDTPAMIITVPAAVAGVPGTATLPIGHSGFRFALGLGLAITGLVADSDTTAVAAGQVKVILSRTV